jgi:tRNA-splicing ligase RtcB
MGKVVLEKVSSSIWRIPKESYPGMRVDGILFVNESLLKEIEDDPALEQVRNVAFLPGILKGSYAMPDIHWGYGFPIGGVAAMDLEEGFVSPGGVGYDINCGVRLLRTSLFWEEVKDKIPSIISALFREVPAGTGVGGIYTFSHKELNHLLKEGVRFLYEKGLADEEDLSFCEEGGTLSGADPSSVSDYAKERGKDQCGTLGSGNHFLELQVVEEVLDGKVAEAFGLKEGMVCVMIHSGSRGLGHQICDDTLKILRKREEQWKFKPPDRQLLSAPIRSSEGERYLSAMRAGANFAWCNRQLITMGVRKAFSKVFGRNWDDLGVKVVYDVAHNIAKVEEHEVDGRKMKVLVHRKGATRAFPPNHPEIPPPYRKVGQPVLIPGDMGRASWVLVGGEKSMELSFGTTCHGAGRRMSRSQAVKSFTVDQLKKDLSSRGVYVMGHSDRGLVEESPWVYKDVDTVVDVVHTLGISRKVCRLKPVGVVKG